MDPPNRFQAIRRLLDPPRFGDSDDQQAIETLFYSQVSISIAMIVILIVGLATVMDTSTVIAVLTTIFGMGLAIWLLRRKHRISSGSLMLLLILCLATYLLIKDEGGFHGIAILAFPGIILVAGLTLNRRLLALYTALSILAIVSVAALEVTGRLDTYFNRLGYEDTILDAAVGAIILATISIFVNFFVGVNRNNIRQLESQEQALRQTNQRLQLALQAAGMGEWELDLRTRKFLHSDFFSPLAGDPDSEFDLNFIHPDERAALLKALDSLASGVEDSFNLTHRLLHEDGSELWAQSWGHLVRDENAAPAKVTGLTMDISAQVRVENALQQSEALYRQAIEAAGAVPYFLDYQKNTYTFMGSGIEAITGYTTAQMTPDLYNKTLVQYGMLIGEAARYSFEEATQKARRGEIGIWRTDNLIRTRSGSLRWLLDSAIQVRDAHGSIYGSIGILQDITERKQAENEIRKLNTELEQRIEQRTQELEVSNDRLTKALRLANMAYWEFNLNDNYFILNDQFYDVLRTSAAHVGGYHLSFEGYMHHFVYPDDHEFVKARFEAILHGGSEASQENQYEYRVVCGDGDVQYVLVDYQVIYDEKDHPLLAYGYHMDITQRKLFETALAYRSQQLENANRELESFAYTISHDLRAPLRAIQGYARILDVDYAAQLSPDAQHCLENINAGALRMSRLIDDLLEFSRLGRQTLSRKKVNPGTILEHVVKELRPEYENRPVQFEIQPMPDCLADPALLNLVYENLLSNALKYSRGRDPAVITVGAQDRDGETVYTVQDNGIGFDMAYAHKIFGVFQRLHTDDQYEGTGIGLATVQRIIHRHGGRIWAEAVVDQGATFFFILGEGS